MRRPPLPDGPDLIVGLARAGVAAARMLRAHGDVIGTDSGHPEVPDDLEAVLDHFTPFGQTTTSIVHSSPVPRRALPLA